MPNVLTISSSQHYPGSVPDFEIFQGMKNWRIRKLNKRNLDRGVQGHVLPSDSYPSMCLLIADKGYQAVTDICLDMNLVKKRPNQHLSPSDFPLNKQLSSGTIIVDKYSGRFCTLWTLLYQYSHKWKWSESVYDAFLDWFWRWLTIACSDSL